MATARGPIGPMKHCLIVDDSDVIRRIAKHLLATLRFETSEAANARDALALCHDRMPDAILLDWSMPELSGFEFLALLRKQPQGRKPVVLYCMTDNDPGHVSRALASGANEILIKPFDRAGLQRKLIETGLA